jgi:pimeloyl-ACP methyl ester carboxylesterase
MLLFDEIPWIGKPVLCFIVACLTGCAADVGAPSPQAATTGSYASLTPTQAGTYQGTLQQVCDAPLDEVSISPGGEYLVLTQQLDNPISLTPGGKRLVIVSRECLLKSSTAGDCLFLVVALDGVRPLSWSRDGNLFIVENRDTIAQLEMDKAGKPLARITSRAAVSRNVTDTVRTIGFTSANGAEEEASRLEQAYIAAGAGRHSGDLQLGTYVTARGPLGALHQAGTNLELVATFGGKRFTLGLPGPSLSDAMLLPDPGGSAALVEGTGFSSQLRDSGARLLDVPPLSRSIFSTSDGSLRGRFTPRSIRVAGGAGNARLLETGARADLASHPGRALASASLGGANSFGYVLMGPSQQPLISGSLDGTPFRIECEDPHVQSSYVEEHLIGSLDWPIALLSVSHSDPAGLAIVYRGGPTGRVEEFLTLAALRHFHARKWNVLLVAYSGINGAGAAASRRYAQEQVGAVRRDAGAVAAWVRQFHGSGRSLPVVVYGESFGGPPAIATDALLSDRAGGLVLVAPYLRSRPPEEWVARSPLGGNVAYQRRFETALLGIGDEADRARLNNQISHLIANARSGRPALIVSAQDDHVSLAEDATPLVQSGADQRVIPGDHLVITAVTATWQVIDRWLDSNLRPLGGGEPVISRTHSE